MISLDFIISLMEEEEVKNVYFNPSVPPPGSGIDRISLRYKICTILSSGVRIKCHL